MTSYAWLISRKILITVWLWNINMHLVQSVLGHIYGVFASMLRRENCLELVTYIHIYIHQSQKNIWQAKCSILVWIGWAFRKIPPSALSMVRAANLQVNIADNYWRKIAYMFVQCVYVNNELVHCVSSATGKWMHFQESMGEGGVECICDTAYADGQRLQKEWLEEQMVLQRSLSDCLFVKYYKINIKYLKFICYFNNILNSDKHIHFAAIIWNKKCNILMYKCQSLN